MNKVFQTKIMEFSQVGIFLVANMKQNGGPDRDPNHLTL